MIRASQAGGSVLRRKGSPPSDALRRKKRIWRARSSERARREERLQKLCEARNQDRGARQGAIEARHRNGGPESGLQAIAGSFNDRRLIVELHGSQESRERIMSPPNEILAY
jgi:hypothetical protein